MLAFLSLPAAAQRVATPRVRSRVASLRGVCVLRWSHSDLDGPCLLLARVARKPHPALVRCVSTAKTPTTHAHVSKELPHTSTIK